MINSIIFKTKNSSVDVINDSEVKLTEIQGVSAIASINSTSISGHDGSTITGSQMDMRNITMILRFLGGDAEECKHRLYKCFPVKSNGFLYFKTNTKYVMIECIVEKIEIPPNAFPLIGQVSLLCPSPYFSEIETTRQIMAGTVPMFKFPHVFNGDFKISERRDSVIDNFINVSTVDVYPIVIFSAIGDVTNPSIMNVNTYEKMKINIQMKCGDKIVIDTRTGKKSIIKNGTDNIFNYIASDFKFFKLYMGDNYLKYDADSNSKALKTTVLWETLYGGI